MAQSLEINPQSNISITELAQRQADGFSVMRTAHVGNAAPYNLALAQAGIQTLLVDHTITGVDKNYFPELVLTQANAITVAQAGRLVCRSEVSEVPSLLQDITNTTYLDELHVTGLQAAIPTANVFTNTEYLRKNEAIAGEIVTLAAAEMPELFTRIVGKDGVPYKMSDAAERVPSLGILQLNNDPRDQRAAVIMPNTIDIVNNFVVEALTSDRAVQYHVSGPDMLRYTRQDEATRQAVDALYQLVKDKSSFGRQLPPVLTVELVTGADAKFATTMKRRPVLDDFFKVMSEFEAEQAAIAADRKAFFTSDQVKDSQGRQQFETTVKSRKTRADAAAAAAVNAVAELFTPVREAGNITQYDVLLEGGLYVPPQTMNASMEQLADITRSATAVKKRCRS